MSQSAATATVKEVGRKTARACDSCTRRRAQWYCVADDAYLCQACDNSVHSANPLARRHHRLQLKASSSTSVSVSLPIPTWHHGFKRKARTPRPNHHKSKPASGGIVPPFVPEIETSNEDENNETDQLPYRVPILDQVLTEFYSPPIVSESSSEAKTVVKLSESINTEDSNNGDGFVGYIPSDMDLSEFAADMENLLGRGLDSGTFCMEELGLGDANCSSGEVKEEAEYDIEVCNNGNAELYDDMEFSQEETLDIAFEHGTPTTGDEEQELMEMEDDEGMVTGHMAGEVGLRLDYDAIIDVWSAQGVGSPWTDGQRPQLGPDDCWLECMGMSRGGEMQGVMQCVMGGGGHFDEGREARVMRYREKRRTRLFSKKIRYEVRKLNAEKRPRMKGRFVKRALFSSVAVGASFSS